MAVHLTHASEVAAVGKKKEREKSSSRLLILSTKQTPSGCGGAVHSLAPTGAN